MRIGNISTKQLLMVVNVSMGLTCAETFLAAKQRPALPPPPPLILRLVGARAAAAVRGGGNLDNSPWMPGANPNVGYPNQPSWSFDKAPPKASLKSIEPGGRDQSGTAAAWILNIVEFAHWLTLPATFLGSYAIMLKHDFWLKLFDGSELRVLFWCLAPLVGFIGGLPPIVMHTYESWQVAPFRNPIQAEFVLANYNNAWLREVAYKYLFIIQSIGLVMAYHGYKGFGTSVGITIALILISYIGDQSKKATFLLNGQPVFPIPIVAMPLFIWGVTCNLLGAISLAGRINDPLVHWGLIIAPLLTAAGGVVEGLLAESTFNQWIHLSAVIMMSAGSLLQGYCLFEVPGLFR